MRSHSSQQTELPDGVCPERNHSNSLRDNVNNLESGANAHTVHLANFSQAWDQIISLFLRVCP